MLQTESRGPRPPARPSQAQPSPTKPSQSLISLVKSNPARPIAAEPSRARSRTRRSEVTQGLARLGSKGGRRGGSVNLAAANTVAPRLLLHPPSGTPAPQGKARPSPANAKHGQRPAEPNQMQPKPSRAQPSPAEHSQAQPSPAKFSSAQPSPAKSNQAQPSPAKPSRVQPNPAEPSRAQPSQAKPTQVQPSPAKPSRARGKVGRGGPAWPTLCGVGKFVLSTFRAPPRNSLKNTLRALVEHFITHVEQGNRFILV